MALLLSTVVVLPIRSVGAYANWLKCYVELDDPEEVIMHQHIIPPEDQPDHEKVYVEIQPYRVSKCPWMVATPQQLRDLFPSSVDNNHNNNHNNTAYSSARTTANTNTTALLKVRLKVPNGLKRKNVQFVVEATGEGASFVGPGVQCDGRRAFSKRHDHHVLLQIRSVSPSSIVGEREEESTDRIVADDDDDKEEEDLSSLLRDIELVAGWAAGYEAVKLTPKMVVRRDDSTAVRAESTSNEEGNNDNRGSEL